MLKWISGYAVQVYITPDSAVSYLKHARIAQTLHDARLQPKIVEKSASES